MRRKSVHRLILVIFVVFMLGSTEPMAAQSGPEPPAPVYGEAVGPEPSSVAWYPEWAAAVMATTITVDYGCGVDGPCTYQKQSGEVRECDPSDPWICVSCHRTVYNAVGGGAAFARTDQTPSCWLGWKPDLSTGGRYEIKVFIPVYNQGMPKSTRAVYAIRHANGTSNRTVNQSNNAGNWVSLGTYRCNSGTNCRVTLENYTGEVGRVIDVDAARFILQVPDTPSRPTISNPDGDGNYTVDWPNAVGATSYRLQEDDNPDFSSPVTRYSGSRSQASVSGRPPGTWYYRVRASNSSGNSAWSNTRSVTVKPNEPTLYSISNSNRDVNYTVDWSSQTAATEYLLQVDDNPSFSSPSTAYSGPGTQFDVTRQAAGTWYYRVRASNGGGDSGWSDVVSTSVGDVYEPDDGCAQAMTIPTDGTPQRHTFHAAGDVDWLELEVEAGRTYVVETSNVSGGANTLLELYDTCGGVSVTNAGDSFAPGARLVWTAMADGSLYLRVSNVDAEAGGPDVGYDLNVRPRSERGVAVIVAGHNDAHTLQSNINWASNLAYRTFTGGGFLLDHVYYLNDESQDADGGGSDVDAQATLANLEYAITTWAAQWVDAETPFYLYLIDHGGYDAFMLSGTEEVLTVEQLDDWLTELESSTTISRTVVIVEACRSGSFIDNPETISKVGRIIITSTSHNKRAFTSAQGAHFSDVFFTALAANKNLYTSFRQAEDAVEATGLSQTPWLDDNGDGVSDHLDGQNAAALGLCNGLGEEEPAILSVTVQLSGDVTGTISALIRDDIGVDPANVWAEIYPPIFVEPEPGDDFDMPELDVPRVDLVESGVDHVFTAEWGGFIYPGDYRIVIYAMDRAGNFATPEEALLELGELHLTYLPMVTRDP